MNQPMMTTQEVANHFKAQQSDVAYWCRTGLIKAVRRDGTRRWMIPASEVTRLEREGIPPSRRTLEART